MRESMLILFLGIIPIAIVTAVFRARAAPLQTKLPEKLGTMVVVYGILIPFLPLCLAIFLNGHSASLFFETILDPTIQLNLGLKRGSLPVILAFFYSFQVLWSFALAGLVNWAASDRPVAHRAKKWIRNIVVSIIDALNIVDETQMLISKCHGILEVDLLQDNYVYLGNVDSKCLGTHFGLEAIRLRDVIKIDALNATTASPSYSQIGNGVQLKELVVPISKISNVNLRKRLTSATLMDQLNNLS